mmetsp:Transcript_69251/g.150720  ORF Transcript_69251/g.150720 Transcript_69251/m.150720 type:complete len:315 (-) Transcript_69251:947-1891(-)
MKPKQVDLGASAPSAMRSRCLERACCPPRPRGHPPCPSRLRRQRSSTQPKGLVLVTRALPAKPQQAERLHGQQAALGAAAPAALATAASRYRSEPLVASGPHQPVLRRNGFGCMQPVCPGSFRRASRLSRERRLAAASSHTNQSCRSPGGAAGSLASGCIRGVAQNCQQRQAGRQSLVDGDNFEEHMPLVAAPLRTQLVPAGLLAPGSQPAPQAHRPALHKPVDCSSGQVCSPGRWSHSLSGWPEHHGLTAGYDPRAKLRSPGFGSPCWMHHRAAAAVEFHTAVLPLRGGHQRLGAGPAVRCTWQLRHQREPGS